MFRRRRDMVFAIAGYKALVVILLFSVSCYAKRNKTCHSSCGDIDDITYPFRLKSDPESCGDKDFELSCENNRLVLYLNSGKYYVLAIDYDNKKIRIVDVGIQKDNCSSLPLYDSLTDYLRSHQYDIRVPTTVAVFMNCEKAVRSHSARCYYIDTSATSSGGNNCNSKEDNSSFSSVKVKGVYSYVMVGDYEEVMVSDVAESCAVERVTLFTSAALGEENGRSNFYFLDLHNAMASGFELVPGYIGEGSTITFWTQLILTLAGTIIIAAIALRTACGMPFAFGFLIYKFRRRHLSGFDDIEGFFKVIGIISPPSDTLTLISK